MEKHGRKKGLEEALCKGWFSSNKKTDGGNASILRLFISWLPCVRGAVTDR
jgi:hypothetical protein